MTHLRTGDSAPHSSSNNNCGVHWLLHNGEVPTVLTEVLFWWWSTGSSVIPGRSVRSIQHKSYPSSTPVPNRDGWGIVKEARDRNTSGQSVPLNSCATDTVCVTHLRTGDSAPHSSSNNNCGVHWLLHNGAVPTVLTELLFWWWSIGSSVLLGRSVRSIQHKSYPSSTPLPNRPCRFCGHKATCLLQTCCLMSTESIRLNRDG